MEITSEKTIGTVNKDQRERMKQNHRATNVKERFPALQNQTEHNLQSQSTIHQSRNIKKNETHNIPTIVSGQSSQEDTDWATRRRIAEREKRKTSIISKMVNSKHIKHKIIIIGDSHV